MSAIIIDEIKALERGLNFGNKVRALTPPEVSDALIEGDTPLEAWRKHRGFSQIDLSFAAEVKFTLIVAIENCEAEGSDKAIGRLAKVLGVQAAQLL